MKTDRITSEKKFHDDWASTEDANKINVLASNEACTAPEMRYITKRLGNLKGRTLLDVGCGLGEASVYFALHGADVTSTDLSEGMLNVTSMLAEANGVKVRTHLASAEDMMLPEETQFDIIYAGNLLHHVDIDTTLKKIKVHLAPGGILVTWDPLAYNPVINVYRRFASSVRTLDEHPLTLKDLKIFRNHFKRVECKYFWFFTLFIFIIMALVQRRNPNKERYWKSVVDEGPKWEWIYKPLEIIDRVTLFLLPPLRLLCWNVVVVAKNEKKIL